MEVKGVYIDMGDGEERRIDIKQARELYKSLGWIAGEQAPMYETETIELLPMGKNTKIPPEGIIGKTIGTGPEAISLINEARPRRKSR